MLPPFRRTIHRSIIGIRCKPSQRPSIVGIEGNPCLRPSQWQRLLPYSSSPHVEEGQVFKMEHKFTQKDVASYVDLLGDTNPIHSQPAAAQSAGFNGCVVHGMLCASLFPAVIKSAFPKARLESKSLRFKEPVLVGDFLEAEVKVLEVHRESPNANLS